MKAPVNMHAEFITAVVALQRRWGDVPRLFRKDDVREALKTAGGFEDSELGIRIPMALWHAVGSNKW